MIHERYFQATKDYFWQWEEDSHVLGIPNKSTIAYRDMVLEVLYFLKQQGIPPFGALLLAIIATNPKGSTQISEVMSALRFGDKNTFYENKFPEVEKFLRVLADLPVAYKQGKNRLLLFQTIFENCHNMASAQNSKRILTTHAKSNFECKATIEDYKIWNIDLKTIDLLSVKFPSVDSVVEKMLCLPDLEDNQLNLSENIDVDAKKDFVTMLIENDKSFHVGTLIRQLWSGLNIPVHSALPSQQPLGGISDLTNKGDFDRLLLSEFANDDLVFLSRLANNEALFIQREIPPMNQDMARIILIDITLKNWGTPKIVAFATMLAIAKHPKTNIECSAYIIGDTYTQIDISSTTGIIDGMRYTDANLHAVNGLTAFFKDFPSQKNREIFVITNPSTLKQTAMLKAMNEYQAMIQYWIYADAEGNVDVYKKQQSSKKHLQHLTLPLQKLWHKEGRKEEENIPVNKNKQYPLLVARPRNTKSIYIIPNFGKAKIDVVFMITRKKSILKSSLQPITKGWELIYENINTGTCKVSFGFTSDSNNILLMHETSKKIITLLNLNTNSRIEISSLSLGKIAQFVFWNNQFHYKSNSQIGAINLDGTIERPSHSGDIEAKLSIFNQQAMLPSWAMDMTLSLININKIIINDKNNLVFNGHELLFDEYPTKVYNNLLHRNDIYLKYNGSEQNVKVKVTFDWQRTNSFVFPDKSIIEINQNGIYILRSSNEAIPTIYVAAVIDIPLGIATSTHFAGNTYYQNLLNVETEIIDTSVFYKRYINAFIRNIINFDKNTGQTIEFTDTPTEFPGGNQGMNTFISNNVQYPIKAREQRLQGKVVLRFIVEKDGSINNITIIEKVHPLLDEEAIRVVKLMPNWKPGEQNENKVRVAITLPITFKLD